MKIYRSAAEAERILQRGKFDDEQRAASVKAIVARGGRYSMKLGGCNVFVEDDADVSVRRDAAHKMYDEGAINEIYKLSEFKRLLWAEEE